MRKLLIITVFIAVAFFLTPRISSAFDKCDQNCSKCHTLTTQQAKDVLTKLVPPKMMPDVKVLEVAKGPIKGLWEVGVDMGGRKMVVYIDYSKKKVIVGSIINPALKKNYTKESLQRITKVDYALIPLRNSLVMGNKNAKHKIVVFIDPV